MDFGKSALQMLALVSLCPCALGSPIHYMQWLDNDVPVVAAAPPNGLVNADFLRFRITNTAPPGAPGFVQTHLSFQEVSLDGSGTGLGMVDEYIALYQGKYTDTQELQPFASILSFQVSHSDPVHFLLASPLPAGDYTVVVRTNAAPSEPDSGSAGYSITMSGIEHVGDVPEPAVSVLLASAIISWAGMGRRRRTAS